MGYDYDRTTPVPKTATGAILKKAPVEVFEGIDTYKWDLNVYSFEYDPHSRKWKKGQKFVRTERNVLFSEIRLAKGEVAMAIFLGKAVFTGYFTKDKQVELSPDRSLKPV
jgi:hypothetical protein